MEEEGVLPLQVQPETATGGSEPTQPAVTQTGQTGAYPGVVGDERMGSSRRSAVGGEQIWFTDQRVVAFVVDSRVDEPAVHPPGTVSCNTHTAALTLRRRLVPAPTSRHRHVRRETCSTFFGSLCTHFLWRAGHQLHAAQVWRRQLIISGWVSCDVLTTVQPISGQHPPSWGGQQSCPHPGPPQVTQVL